MISPDILNKKGKWTVEDKKKVLVFVRILMQT